MVGTGQPERPSQLTVDAGRDGCGVRVRPIHEHPELVAAEPAQQVAAGRRTQPGRHRAEQLVASLVA